MRRTTLSSAPPRLFQEGKIQKSLPFVLTIRCQGIPREGLLEERVRSAARGLTRALALPCDCRVLVSSRRAGRGGNDCRVQIRLSFPNRALVVVNRKRGLVRTADLYRLIAETFGLARLSLREIRPREGAVGEPW